MAGLVSSDWLESRLGDPDLVLIEVSFFKPPTAAWHEGHIPGARYVYWKDLCWDATARQFPSPEVMSERLGDFGATADSKVVLIGDPIQFAAYAYWVFALTGLESGVFLLDGGTRTWRELGKVMTRDLSPAETTDGPRPGSPVEGARVGRDDVLEHLGDAHRILLDLRSNEEFTGERVAPTFAPFDHGAERGGRIPGATHLPFERFLNQDGTFLDAAEMEKVLTSVGVRLSDEIITYCRLSHRASLGWFALTRVGARADVKVYDGSWTEWGSMVGMPIER